MVIDITEDWLDAAARAMRADGGTIDFAARLSDQKLYHRLAEAALAGDSVSIDVDGEKITGSLAGAALTGNILSFGLEVESVSQTA